MPSQVEPTSRHGWLCILQSNPVNLPEVSHWTGTQHGDCCLPLPDIWIKEGLGSCRPAFTWPLPTPCLHQVDEPDKPHTPASLHLWMLSTLCLSGMIPGSYWDLNQVKHPQPIGQHSHPAIPTLLDSIGEPNHPQPDNSEVTGPLVTYPRGAGGGGGEQLINGFTSACTASGDSQTLKPWCQPLPIGLHGPGPLV